MIKPTDRFFAPIARWRAVAKRSVDIIGAAGLIPVMAPFWLGLMILIRLDSPGPVLFRQVRVGRQGRLFTLYKLRSMVHGAEDATGPVWAKDPDPRETRVGRFLRRYGLDETMQLINILKGEMSFVGPRPERPFFVEQLKHELVGYSLRTLIKPGLTGWAQVHMKRRYDLSVHDVRTKLVYDLEYIGRQSFCLDLLILLKTVTVFTGRRQSSEAPPSFSSAARPSRKSVQVS